MKQIITKSEQETKTFANNLAYEIHSVIIALTGELGAGKTAFVQGFAKGLGIKEKVISPTFILIRQHNIPKIQKKLIHIDLYRLENISDIKNLGLEDLWSNPQNIVLIEWADKIKKLLPKNTIWINIQKQKENTRLITVE